MNPSPSRARVRLPLAMKLPDAAQYAGVSEWALRGAAKRGELPLIRIGRKHYVTPLDLERWVESKREAS